MIFIFLEVNQTPAQTFNARITSGLNYSQIRGDGLSGLNRAGLHAGLGLNLTTQSQWEWNMELLYNERGSAGQFKIIPGSPSNGISLKYVDIPVYVAYKDWLDPNMEDSGFFRMRYIFGLSAGRLIESKINNLKINPDGDSEEVLREFSKYNFSWLLGTTVFLNRSFSVHVRYTRSISLLFNTKKNTDIRTNSLLESFLTFRISYHL